MSGGIISGAGGARGREKGGEGVLGNFRSRCPGLSTSSSWRDSLAAHRQTDGQPDRRARKRLRGTARSWPAQPSPSGSFNSGPPRALSAAFSLGAWLGSSQLTQEVVTSVVVVIVVALTGYTLGTTSFFSTQSENLVLRNNCWRPRGEGGHASPGGGKSVSKSRSGAVPEPTPQPKRNKK